MSKWFWKKYLKLRGWKPTDFPDVEKAVVLMAPHTSIFDFVLGKVFFLIHGRKPMVLIKKEAFFWPFGFFLKKMGGIPVDRGRKTGITDMAIENFKNTPGRFYLVITPEGTRKKTKNWKKGFIRIAKAAEVPIALGFLDKKSGNMGINGLVSSDGDEAEIMEKVKKSYLGCAGIRKNKFETGYE